MGFDQLAELFGPAGYVLGLMLGAGIWLFRDERKERKASEQRERDHLLNLADVKGQHAADLHDAISVLADAQKRLGG